MEAIQIECTIKEANCSVNCWSLENLRTVTDMSRFEQYVYMIFSLILGLGQ